MLTHVEFQCEEKGIEFLSKLKDFRKKLINKLNITDHLYADGEACLVNFPFKENKFSANDIEMLCHGVDTSCFFDYPLLKLDTNKCQKKYLDHLMSVNVNEKNLYCMLGWEWLVETAIDVGITYLMRNRTIGKKFFLWSNSVLCQVLDYIFVFLCQKKKNQGAGMETACAQLFIFYTCIINEKII